MSSGVNMLTNSLNVADTTESEFFKLILFQTDQKARQKYCHADLSSVLDSLAC